MQEAHNLRVSVLLLYSSLVLKSGFNSLIKRTSKVRSLEYLFALARMLIESSEKLTEGSQVSICLLIVYCTLNAPESGFSSSAQSVQYSKMGIHDIVFCIQHRSRASWVQQA